MGAVRPRRRQRSHGGKSQEAERSKRGYRRHTRHYQNGIIQVRKAISGNKSEIAISEKKKLATTRSKKNLQGLYEAVPDDTVLVKTTDATLTLKMPGQKDTVPNKSNMANFATTEQRNIALINFAARKTVKNHHKKFEEFMRNHGKAQLNKIMGIRTIRKRDTQPRDPHARSNQEKVLKTKVPPKRRYIYSPIRANMQGTISRIVSKLPGRTRPRKFPEGR